MTMRIGENLLLLAIMLIASSVVYAVLATVANIQAREPVAPWTPPEITKCDLPIWDRIRHLCPQEGDTE